MDPISMAVIGAGLAGTAMTAFGAIQQGNAANAVAKFEARQLDNKAKAVTAAGQHAALDKRRESNLIASRAQALAGASGAGALDPGVLAIMTGIQKEGDLAFQTELFNAKDEANTLTAQAGARRFEGKQMKKASRVQAMGTALSGIADAGMSFGMMKSVGLSNANAFSAMAHGTP